MRKLFEFLKPEKRQYQELGLSKFKSSYHVKISLFCLIIFRSLVFEHVVVYYSHTLTPQVYCFKKAHSCRVHGSCIFESIYVGFKIFGTLVTKLGLNILYLISKTNVRNIFV